MSGESESALVELRRVADVTLVAPDPFDADRFYPISEPQYAAKVALKRAGEWRGKVEALGDLAGVPTADLKAMRRAMEADDKTLTQYPSKVKDGITEAVGMTDRVRLIEVQLKGPKRSVDPLSARGIIEAQIARVDAELERREPPRPAHTYAFVMTCTDAALEKVRKTAEKEGAEGFMFAAAQSQKAERQIQKWFEENVR